ncbi:lytic transglycosylase domain-containing protein [Mariprofundus ferrooxydans]|uniref:lytic transglycosylase domain-containing protein n=1 Tax=Mariprofundus ferrooxydans TaxID=314344 RepID=UPI001430C258|nr:lytic transglycosylase domain-containing protein [Mariprofundus ferrooxydans]
MNSYQNIGVAGWSLKPVKLPEQGGTHTAAGLFQQYLDKSSGGGLPLSDKTLTPDAIRTLAANLISALERASMHALFSESGSGASDAGFASTDLFMAMRNSAVMPAASAVPVAAEKPAISTPAKKDSEPPVISTKEEIKQSGVVPGADTRAQYGPVITRAAAAFGLDPKLIEAVIQTESGFNAQAVSPVGAQGLMQLMPGTAADLGVKDAFDPEQNIQAGSKYLKQLMDRYHGDTGLALAAYNWGMGNLERNPERMPQETVNYVAKITGLMNHNA